VGKEARSLKNLFVFREFEKSSKMTPRGSFFVSPCEPKKEIKGCSVAFSCFFEHEKEQRLSSVCPQHES
jgi:hypothetical protein